jgi:hypothetical protein
MHTYRKQVVLIGKWRFLRWPPSPPAFSFCVRFCSAKRVSFVSAASANLIIYCMCVCAKIVCVSISTHCELMEQIYITALASAAATIWHMRKSTFKRHVTRLNFNRKCVAFLARITSICCKRNQGLRASIDQSGGCWICAGRVFVDPRPPPVTIKIRQT